jgi:hypothetical protein
MGSTFIGRIRLHIIVDLRLNNNCLCKGNVSTFLQIDNMDP